MSKRPFYVNNSDSFHKLNLFCETTTCQHLGNSHLFRTELLEAQ